MAKTNFPTEEVTLPSKGYFYPKENPLSSGKVEMKYMTAKEEDILTSPNLLRKGTAVDKLLEALITDKKVKIADMMLGDKNALLIAARILAYGKEYKYKIQTEDGDTEEATVDLSQLKDKEVDVSKLEKGVNDFPFTLPNSQRDITFRFLTNQDETHIDMEIKKLSKISSQLVTQMTSRFKRMITSVDGNSDRAVVNTFIDTEFLSLDSLALRKHMTQITPDVDLVTTAKFDDGREEEVVVEITAQFFWPTS